MLQEASAHDHPTIGSPAGSPSTQKARLLPDVPGVSENSQSIVASTSGPELQLQPLSPPLYPSSEELLPAAGALTSGSTPQIGDVLEALYRFQRIWA